MAVANSEARTRMGMPATGEIALAGRVAGLLWITACLVMGIGLLLPGTRDEHPVIVTVLAVGGALWGLACLWLPFERLGPLAFHLPAALSLPTIAVLVAASGGADSPAFLLLFFVMAFVAYFFPPGLAVVYLVGCAVVQALPFIYDASAIDDGLLGEIVIALPGYAVLGGFILVCKSQLMRLRDDAERLSLLDPLTGLANRRALMERLRALDLEEAAGLLILDVDSFRQVNTLHGHPAGDEVLRAVGKAMRSATRGADLVARLGGDEFAIVAGGMSPTAMDRLASRLLEAIRAANGRLDLPDYRLSASVGWALYPDDAGSQEELMRLADGAERVAKDTGKDRAVAPLSLHDAFEVSHGAGHP